MTDFQKKRLPVRTGISRHCSLFYVFKKMLELGQGKIENKQAPGSRGIYRAPPFERLLEHLLPKIESHAGLQLYKTYSYARMGSVKAAIVTYRQSL